MIMINVFRKIFVLLLLVFVWNQIVFADGTSHGSITGTVVDKETGDPLPSVNIVVEGTSLGASTNFKGEFFILGVPAGSARIGNRDLGVTVGMSIDERQRHGRQAVAKRRFVETDDNVPDAVHADESVAVHRRRSGRSEHDDGRSRPRKGRIAVGCRDHDLGPRLDLGKLELDLLTRVDDQRIAGP